MNDQPPPKVRPGVLFTAFLVALVLILAWNMLPMLAGGGPSNTTRIVINLRQIELAKDWWAFDHGVTGSVRVSEQDLAPYLRGNAGSNGLVKPVVGERYIIHRLGMGPEAQLTRGYGKLLAGTVIRLRPDSNHFFRIFLPPQGGLEAR